MFDELSVLAGRLLVVIGRYKGLIEALCVFQPVELKESNLLLIVTSFEEGACHRLRLVFKRNMDGSQLVKEARAHLQCPINQTGITGKENIQGFVDSILYDPEGII